MSYEYFTRKPYPPLKSYKSERAESIFQMRMEGKTFKAISKHFGLTESRVKGIYYIHKNKTKNKHFKTNLKGGEK